MYRKQKQNCNVDKRNTRRRRRRTEAEEKIVFPSVFPSERKEKRGRKRKTFFCSSRLLSLSSFVSFIFFAFKEGGKVKGERKEKRRRQTRRAKQMKILIVPAKLFQFFCGQTMPSNFDCS